MNAVRVMPADLIGELTAHEARHAPEALYLAGDPATLDAGQRISVVGSRKVTDDGARRTRALCRRLVRRGVVIVSGLAEGVDTIAHTTAIEAGGRTVAVLGSPLDDVHPRSNAALFERIAREHLAVSQFPSGSRVHRGTFPMRNRTMALLTDATIIVEAGETSGTRHQGWEAIRLGRPLFLLESVVGSGAASWAAEMLEYGAQTLTRDTLDDVLEELPRVGVAHALAF